MSARTLIGFGLAAFALAACIPSVNPWYTPDDVRFASELIGEWRQSDGPSVETWAFERLESEDAYALRISTDEEQGRFKAVLFELGEHRFLDLIASDVDLANDQHPLVDVSIFPGHLVMHVAAIDPELRIAFCDSEWIEEFIDQNPGALSHRIEGDRALLTGTTSELQRFLLEHVGDGELFRDYGQLTR